MSRNLSTVLLALLLSIAAHERIADRLAAQDKKLLTDRHGDPLPEGATARLGTVRYRHASQVTAVLYSPDGKLIATTGFDETVRLWASDTGKEIFRFRLDSKPNLSRAMIAFSPDGKRLAGAQGSGAGALCVWDTTTGKELLKRDLLTQDATTLLAFTDNANKIVVCGFQSKFDVKTGKRWVEPSDRQWDIQKGAETPKFRPPDATVAYLPDGKSVLEFDDGGLHISDPQTGKRIRTLTKDKIHSRPHAFSPDGMLAIQGKEPDTVQIWDTATGRAKGLIKGKAEDFRHLALSADGKRLASSSFDDTLRVWDIEKGKILLLQRVSAYSKVGCIALSHDGKTLATGSINSVFALRRWDVDKAKEIPGPDGHVSPVSVVGFAADDKVVTGPGNPIRIWDPANGKQIAVLEEPEPIRIVALASDGRSIAIGREDYSVGVRDLATGKEKNRFDGKAGYTRALNLSPDGKTLVVGYRKQLPQGIEDRLFLWDIDSGKKRHEITKLQLGDECLAFSPDGTKLISTGMGLRIWDPRSGKEIGKIPIKFGISGNNAARFSADGAYIAAPCYPKGFSVWDVATRDSLDRYDSDGVTVRSVAFSPDNKLLACGKEDGTVELWDIKKWKPVGRGQGPRGRVYALAFSKDSRTLISGHEDTTALVWDVAKLIGPAPK